MTRWKKQSRYMVLCAAMLSLCACVTESQTGSSFKTPTKADLDNAISLYVQISYQYLESKDYEHAMSSVKRALDIDKNSPVALNALAVVYQYQGDTDKADITFKKTLAKNEKFSEGHLNYGSFLYQIKDYSAACKQFQFAADDDFYANRALAYYHLSRCFRANGESLKADAALDRCVGLDPNNSSALLALAGIKFQKMLYPESKALFDKHAQLVRASGQALSPEALWLGIRLARRYKEQDSEASLGMFLKKKYPSSQEYLDYIDSQKSDSQTK